MGFRVPEMELRNRIRVKRISRKVIYVTWFLCFIWSNIGVQSWLVLLICM
ncbi:hypothetical protein HanRHA438_Chr06g0274331 [Helianthus annuus]|nr:hypothetical protein HanRHA438_Chr06g0274331 [Helianthus annuus]